MTRKAHTNSVVIKKSRSAREELAHRGIMRVSMKDVLIGAKELEKRGMEGLGGMALIGMAKAIAYREDITNPEQSKDRSSKVGLEPYMGIANYVQNPFNLDVFSDMVMFSAIHMSCLDTLCNDITGNGWRIESPEDDVSTSFVEKWLNKVNLTGETVTDVLYKMMMDRFLTGNYCCEIVSDKLNVNIVEMNHVNARKINPHRTAFMTQGNATPLFKYKETQRVLPIYFKKFGEQREWNAFEGILAAEGTDSSKFATELLWNSDYFPSLAPYYGLPLLVPGWSASEAFNHQRVFNLSYFETMGIKVAIIVKGQLDEKGEEYLDDYFESEATGEVLKSLLLYSPTKDVEFDIKDMAAQPTDASFTSLNDQATREIFLLWKVPPYRAGATIDVGALGGNYVKESSKIYIQTTLAPKQKDCEDVVNQLIHCDRGFTINPKLLFKLNSIDVTDIDVLMRKVELGMQYGLLNRKQAADLLEIGDFKEGEGQEYFIMQNIIPIEMSGMLPPDALSAVKMLEHSMRRKLKE
jgi:hypothetical protein